MDDFTLSLLTNKELLVLPSEDFRGEQLRRSDGEADWKNTSTKTGMITAASSGLSGNEPEKYNNSRLFFEYENPHSLAPGSYDH